MYDHKLLNWKYFRAEEYLREGYTILLLSHGGAHLTDTMSLLLSLRNEVVVQTPPNVSHSSPLEIGKDSELPEAMGAT
jgi:hypothetical protein